MKMNAIVVVGSVLLVVCSGAYAAPKGKDPAQRRLVCECACQSLDGHTRLEGGVILNAPFGDPSSCGNLTPADEPVRCNSDDPPMYLHNCSASTKPAMAHLLEVVKKPPSIVVADPGRTAPSPPGPTTAASTVAPVLDQ
jgi:hypothetical protein